MMLPKALVLLTALCTNVLAFSPSKIARRASTYSLYGYGNNGDIGGLRVYYADGLAYIGRTLSNASVVSNVTFTTSSNTVSISSANDTNITGMKLVIDPSSNDAVGFTSNTSSSQSADQFVFFGSRLFRATTAGQLESSFYAEPTGQDRVWLVKWLSDIETAGSAVPISLKNDAPAKLAIIN